MHDFDFLVGGEWHVENRVLAQRLCGCTEWTEFDARLLGVRKILGGLGNIDRFVCEREGRPFEAVSLRLFNPQTGNWTIYWADTETMTLTEQVVGRFENGVGEFFGSEVFGGRTVELRFRWSDISARSARWEQAYRDDASGQWETNWIMRFTRREPQPATDGE